MSSGLLTGMSHTHAASWIILVILFVLSLIFKRQKITPILLRIFYLIMLASGITMLVGYDFPLKPIVKGGLAIVLIGLMEMALGRAKRGGKGLPVLIAAVVVVLTVVVLMGYSVINF